MTIVIHDAAIATVDDCDTVHYGAAIAIEQDRIAAIGPSAEILALYPTAEKMDGSGSGTTLALEDSNDVDHYAAALADTGMRFVLGERAYDRVGTSIGDPGPFQVDRALGQRHLRTIERNFRDWNGAADGRIRVAISAWAPDMCSPELLQDVTSLQTQLDTWVTIHLNQIWGEVAAVKAHCNQLPTEYLADLDFLNERVICAHCRCMEPGEEKLLGQARVTVAFNAAIAARRGLSPRIADLDPMAALSAWALTTWRRTWSR